MTPFVDPVATPSSTDGRRSGGRALLALCGAIWILGATAVSFADPVAVVAAVGGRVEVTPAGARAAVRAAFGRPLDRGDRVTVGPGARATLFFGDGNVIELSERSVITIGGRVANATRQDTLTGDVYVQVSRYVTAGSRETGLVAISRMRGDGDPAPPLLLSPRRTALLDDSPDLSWRTVSGAERYQVRVLTTTGVELWNREVIATDDSKMRLTWPVEVPPLAAETEVEWEVEAIGAHGTLRRESTTIRTLAAPHRDAINTNLERIRATFGEATPAARFLSASYLSELGVFADAAGQFHALATLVPDAPELHEALGNVYLRVGLTDLAAREFRLALAMHRDGR